MSLFLYVFVSFGVFFFVFVYRVSISNLVNADLYVQVDCFVVAADIVVVVHFCVFITIAFTIFKLFYGHLISLQLQLMATKLLHLQKKRQRDQIEM